MRVFEHGARSEIVQAITPEGKCYSELRLTILDRPLPLFGYGTLGPLSRPRPL